MLNVGSATADVIPIVQGRGPPRGWRDGCDLVTDGELRRNNVCFSVSGKCDDVRLLTLAEMLNVVEDTAGFEGLLRTIDAPAYSIAGRASGRAGSLEQVFLNPDRSEHG